MASTIKVDKIAQSSGTPEFTIPTADGTAGQFLKTDGSGVLAFDTVTTNPLALTGSTNTWIPTITAADALTGTANFTYDGNILDVKNSGTASSIKLYCENANAHAQEIKAAPHAGSSAWTLTLPGAAPTVSGQVLSATTAGVASWAAGFTDIQKIQEVVASGDTNINFDNTKITSTYSAYEIRYFNVVPSVDNVYLRMSFSDDNGSNFDSNHTGGFFSTWTGSASAGSTYETANDSVSDSFQKLAAVLSFDAGDGAGGIVTIQNPSSASFITTYQGAESHIAADATTRNYTTYIGGMWDSLAAVNYIRFDMTSGNIATGTFQLWGYV
jgi:hypothetical protein